MSQTATTTDQQAIQFGENLVRLEIVCNGLWAFANKDIRAASAAAEAKSLAVFFADELPDLMRQNEAILTSAIRKKGKGDHEAQAAVDITREDQVRLAELITDVIKGLQPIVRSPDRSDSVAVRQAISAYSAALRTHIDWSRKIIFD